MKEFNLKNDDLLKLGLSIQELLNLGFDLDKNNARDLLSCALYIMKDLD